jgi:hypothetical protein
MHPSVEQARRLRPLPPASFRSRVDRRKSPFLRTSATPSKGYKNPQTGEVVETNGGNHKTLKEWKAERGSATVESLADQVILV